MSDLDKLCRSYWLNRTAGLGSILDTVSKDTEDTAPRVSVSVS